MALLKLFQNRQSLVQYAALPLRRKADGAIQICLVTSRGTGKWLVPKGWPKKNLTPHQTVAAEALEEAGLVGEVGRDAIGSYKNKKRLHLLASVRCRIELFPLFVAEELAEWQEAAERERKWFDPAGAVAAVAEPPLARLIEDYCRRECPGASPAAGAVI